jgi:hypothetical protein
VFEMEKMEETKRSLRFLSDLPYIPPSLVVPVIAMVILFKPPIATRTFLTPAIVSRFVAGGPFSGATKSVTMQTTNTVYTNVPDTASAPAMPDPANKKLCDERDNAKEETSLGNYTEGGQQF